MSLHNLAYLKQQIKTGSTSTPLLISTPYQAPLAEFIDWLRKNFPAEQIIEPLAEKTITVKQARKIVEATNHTVLTGEGKAIILLTDAERLSLPAANTLLKSLEESADTLRFILTTRWPKRLPPTIISRTEHIRLVSQRVPVENFSDQPWPASLVERLTSWSQAGRISEEQLELISQALATHLRKYGPSRPLAVAYQRLRDYHRLSQIPGDRKTMSEVLLASLPKTMAG